MQVGIKYCREFDEYKWEPYLLVFGVETGIITFKYLSFYHYYLFLSFFLFLNTTLCFMNTIIYLLYLNHIKNVILI